MAIQDTHISVCADGAAATIRSGHVVPVASSGCYDVVPFGPSSAFVGQDGGMKVVDASGAVQSVRSGLGTTSIYRALTAPGPR